MRKDNPRAFAAQYGDRMAAIDHHMKARELGLALEIIRRILGDHKIPVESRIMLRAKEAEALLGLGRKVEANLAAEQALGLIERHRRNRLLSIVAPVADMARVACGI